MKYENEKEASQFLEEREEQSKTTNNVVGMRIAVARCFDEGVQWVGNQIGSLRGGANGTTRLTTNWHPNGELVATVNRVSAIMQQEVAATFIDKMECEAVPGERDTGIESAMNAEVIGSLCNEMVRFSRYVPAARMVNHRRVIDGTHVLGWGLKIQPREQVLRGGGTETVQDQVLTSFTCPSTHMLLDPGTQELDLHDHEDVVWSEVWGLDKIRRDLGVTLREEDCSTKGELMAAEMWYNALSQNRLYSSLPMFSRTKAARVFQMHSKGDSGRFENMLVGIKTSRGNEVQWINFDNQENPFGGHGLPFTMFHGHRRPDSMWSRSGVAAIKDDQERINLLVTLFNRMLQKHAGWQWMIAKESMEGADADNFKDMFTNTVAGMIITKRGTRDRPIEKPELVQYPDPPAFLQDQVGRYQDDMKEQAHRPGITQGDTKTHVPNSTYTAASQAAGQVLGTRVREDSDRHGLHLTVGVGTCVRMVRDKSPSILAALHRAGFDDTDYQTIIQTDPYYPSCEIRVRESSIRYRSPEEKQQSLWNAVTAQAIDPKTLRRGLAAIDVAMNEDDRRFFAEAQRAAVEVTLGKEWQPFDLGEFSEMFEDAFGGAMFDRRAKRDPETWARLLRAKEGQAKYRLAATQMQQMAENPQPPQPQQPEQPEPTPEQESPSEADLGQLLQAIQQGSTQQQAA